MRIKEYISRIVLLGILPILCLSILYYLDAHTIAYGNALKVLSVTVWLTVWWASGIVPLGVTSLLPLILFPYFDILGTKEVFSAYSNPVLFLFLGGFLFAIAVQQCGLHTRMAINIMMYTGYSPRFLVFGIMLGTALTSMVMSNTVTALMMFPITTGLCMLFTEGVGKGEHTQAITNFKILSMLAVAYSASIGGMATIIGSPPNAITVGIVKELLHKTITFTEWAIIGIPVMFLLLFLTWILLFLFYPVVNIDMERIRSYLKVEKAKLGVMKQEEKVVLLIGAFLLIGWVAEDSWNIPFISSLSDTQVSLCGVLLLFATRVNGKPLLDTQAFSKVEWNILYMFGAGFALSGAYGILPLKEIFSDIFSIFQTMPPLSMAIIFCLLAGFATELTSNSSVTVLLLPIAYTLASDFALSELYTMIGVCFASSCAFMFPSSTPSNAIVFGSGYLGVSDLLRVGACLTVLSALLLGLYSYLLLPFLLS